MKNVFILGAGASARAGVPMMAEFLDRAERLFPPASHEASRDVFKAIAQLQGVFAKSYLDLENIEAVFGAIEMARLVEKLADRDAASIATLRQNLITLIVQTIEATSKFPVRDGVAQPADPYGKFVQVVRDLTKKSNRRMEFAFVTFNYDLTLDHALEFFSLTPDYGLPSKQVVDGPLLLKLHGSINWGTCTTCNEIVPWHIGEIPVPHRHAETMRYSLGSNIGKKLHCNNQPLVGPPVLVPPTWNKSDYHSGLSVVWQKAAVELGQAENIFVIGYSLPESDAFFRYLFALGTVGDTRLKRLWVINPDPDNSVQGRFEAMVGRGIQSRLRFLRGEDGLFHKAIDAIQAELERDVKLMV